MADLDEHHLLRSTARDVFSSGSASRDIVSLGWLGLLTAEDAGGEGFFPYEASLIAMEGGRAGSASTWFMSALVAAFVSRTSGVQDSVEDLLSGQHAAAFAHAPDLSLSLGAVSGTVRRVLSEAAPDLVVLAGPPELGYVVLPTDQMDVRADTATLETERNLFRLSFAGRSARTIETTAAAALGSLALLLVCADTVGALGRAIQIVTQHLTEREAFGVPIASFQVIQHRLVNLTVLHSASEALILSAGRALAAEDPEADQLTLAAHAYIEGRAIQAVDDCIQLTGGIGFTWEFPLHHVLRRVSTNAALLGAGRMSRHRLAVLGGWVP